MCLKKYLSKPDKKTITFCFNRFEIHVPAPVSRTKNTALSEVRGHAGRGKYPTVYFLQAFHRFREQFPIANLKHFQDACAPQTFAAYFKAASQSNYQDGTT